jgi:hypothetical protein
VFKRRNSTISCGREDAGLSLAAIEVMLL